MPDLELPDPAVPVAAGGFFYGIWRTVTFPVRTVFWILRSLVKVVLLPIRLAADLTYGIWRTVMRIVGGVLGVFTGTLRRVLRLVFGIIRLPFRILGKTFKAGIFVGRKVTRL